MLCYLAPECNCRASPISQIFAVDIQPWSSRNWTPGSDMISCSKTTCAASEVWVPDERLGELQHVLRREPTDIPGPHAKKGWRKWSPFSAVNGSAWSAWSPIIGVPLCGPPKLPLIPRVVCAWSWQGGVPPTLAAIGFSAVTLHTFWVLVPHCACGELHLEVLAVPPKLQNGTLNFAGQFSASAPFWTVANGNPEFANSLFFVLPQHDDMLDRPWTLCLLASSSSNGFGVMGRMAYLRRRRVPAPIMRAGFRPASVSNMLPAAVERGLVSNACSRCSRAAWATLTSSSAFACLS